MIHSAQVSRTSQHVLQRQSRPSRAQHVRGLTTSKLCPSALWGEIINSWNMHDKIVSASTIRARSRKNKEPQRTEVERGNQKKLRRKNHVVCSTRACRSSFGESNSPLGSPTSAAFAFALPFTARESMRPGPSFAPTEVRQSGGHLLIGSSE